LPSIARFPLAANIPSIASEPPVSAPVVKFNFPRLSVIRVEFPFQPITEVRVDPIIVRPAFVPDNVLPLLNSMEFVADAEAVTEMKESRMTAMATNFPGSIEQTPYTLADCESSVVVKKELQELVKRRMYNKARPYRGVGSTGAGTPCYASRYSGSSLETAISFRKRCRVISRANLMPYAI
jgi:hypothetical protein